MGRRGDKFVFLEMKIMVDLNVPSVCDKLSYLTIFQELQKPHELAERHRVECFLVVGIHALYRFLAACRALGTFLLFISQAVVLFEVLVCCSNPSR